MRLKTFLGQGRNLQGIITILFSAWQPCAASHSSIEIQRKFEIGVQLGKMYGNDLRRCSDYDGVNVIIPVPLHKSKEMPARLQPG